MEAATRRPKSRKAVVEVGVAEVTVPQQQQQQLIMAMIVMRRRRMPPSGRSV